MPDVPNSYKDPYWASVSEKAANSVGIPPDLLINVVTKGERSNNDQVSEAGARTPFQITPTTRRLILEKYGIDSYLSPENAAQGAALLLKESLDRNGNNPQLAIAEYHGGTNRKNWGPKTTSYVNRVFSEAQEPSSKSTYDKVAASEQQTKGSDMLSDYVNGNLDPEKRQKFEEGLKNGTIYGGPRLDEFIRSGKIDPSAVRNAPLKPYVIPQEVFEAYQNPDVMSRKDRQGLERDVREGLAQLPEGAKIGNTPDLGLVGNVVESVTGSDRATAKTKELQDYSSIPELTKASSGSQQDLDRLISTRRGLLTASGPQEIAQIIKAQFPNVSVSQDTKGNFILKSGVDGQEYAIKPGFQASDIPRAAAQIGMQGAAAGVTGGGSLTAQILKNAGAGALTQAIMEGQKSSVGGDFNTGSVALSGAIGGATPLVSKLVGTLAGKSRGAIVADDVIQNADNAPVNAAAKDIGSVPPQAAQGAEVANDAVNAGKTFEQQAQVMKDAVKGTSNTSVKQEELAALLKPDPELEKAAQNLGISQDTRPEYLLPNTPEAQRTNALIGAVKSLPGSEMQSLETQGLAKIRSRIDDLLTNMGAESDASVLNYNVKEKMQGIVDDLGSKARAIYENIEQKVPKNTTLIPTNTLEFFAERIRDNRGIKYLTPEEKKIFRLITPEKDKDGLVISYPTYSNIDSARKMLVEGRVGRGAFKDTPGWLSDAMENGLLSDQLAALQKLGTGDDQFFQQAQKLTAIKKGVQDTMTDLFGDKLDQSFLGKLGQSIRAIPGNDETKFINLIKSIPDDIKQQVVASSLYTALGKSASKSEISFNAFNKWFSALKQNKRAYAEVMKNLPKGAEETLNDLHKVSQGIQRALEQKIYTGRVNAVLNETFKKIDSLTEKIIGSMMQYGGNLVGRKLGGGITSAIGEVMRTGKSSQIKALDELLSSPQFTLMIKNVAKGNVDEGARILGSSGKFKKIFNEYIKGKDASTPEKWIRSILIGTETSAANRNKEKK